MGNFPHTLEFSTRAFKASAEIFFHHLYLGFFHYLIAIFGGSGGIGGSEGIGGIETLWGVSLFQPHQSEKGAVHSRHIHTRPHRLLFLLER